MEKVQIEANDYLVFYGLVVGELLKFFEEKKIPCKADSVWQKIDPVTKTPYFILFLSTKISKGIVAKCLLDKKGNVLNPLYLYALKNDIKNGEKNVKIYKDRADLYSQFIGYADIEDFIKYGSLTGKIEDHVSKLVLNFYNHMAAGRYKECWNILSPKFRSRDPWKNSFEKFEEGYINTRGIKNIHVFNTRKQTDSVVECFVYYEDGIQRHVIEEFESLSTMSIKNIRNFVDTVEAMQNKITDVGGVGFDNILIQKLFDPTVSEYIWYKCQLAPEVVNTLFPDKKHTWVKRIYVVSCVLIDTQWFIDLIIQDKTYTTR